MRLCRIGWSLPRRASTPSFHAESARLRCPGAALLVLFPQGLHGIKAFLMLLTVLYSSNQCSCLALTDPPGSEVGFRNYRERPQVTRLARGRNGRQLVA